MLGKLLGGALVIGAAALVWSFTPQPLPVPEGPVPTLPALASPSAPQVGVLHTGAMRSAAAFAYRGGPFEAREFGLDVVVVRHPQGTLLIDAGLGRRWQQHLSAVPLLLRWTTTLTPGTSTRGQLEDLGYRPEDLKGVLLTHVHWDHVSGLDDLRDVPVLIDARERDFVADGGTMSLLMRGFGGLRYEVYDFDGGPYAGFAQSHDVFGDGSVVIVPAPGHTPGSVIVFVRTPKQDYAFIGDIAWQHEGVDIPAERPWLSRWLVDDDAARVRELLVQLNRLQAHSDKLLIVPAHDRRIMASLPALAHAPPSAPERLDDAVVPQPVVEEGGDG